MFTWFQFVSLGTVFEVYLCILFTCVQRYANTFKAREDIEEEERMHEKRLAVRELLFHRSAAANDMPFSVRLEDNFFILRLV